VSCYRPRQSSVDPAHPPNSLGPKLLNSSHYNVLKLRPLEKLTAPVMSDYLVERILLDSEKFRGFDTT
jgi:hypothetical protein